MKRESRCEDSGSCTLVELGISYCQEVSRRWQGRQSSERTIDFLNKTLVPQTKDKSHSSQACDASNVFDHCCVSHCWTDVKHTAVVAYICSHRLTVSSKNTKVGGNIALDPSSWSKLFSKFNMH